MLDAMNNALAMPHAADSTSQVSPNFQAPAEVLRALGDSRHPVVFGHVVPDADCLGSALALVKILRAGGADAIVGIPDNCISKRLSFLLDFAPEVPRRAALPPRFDALIVVDTASEKRVNFDVRPSFSGDATSVNIDHHVSNTRFCSINWIDAAASSSCEMVAAIALSTGRPIPADTASLLYAGLIGDTAGFSLPTTTSHTLHIASKLVDAGANVSLVGERLCRSQSREDFDLLRRVYDHTTLTLGGRVSYSFLSYDDIMQSGCGPQDIDDQVSIPRALAGVQVALLFTEGEPGVIRVNLRGEGATSVLPIAQSFGGGGHSQSAGIRMKNRSMQEAIDSVVAATGAHLDATHGTLG